MLGVFQEGIPIQQVIRDTGIENLDFIPSGNGLTYIEERLGSLSIYALRNALHKVAYDYKYIILDCPPTFNSLSKNILIASDGCLIPVTPQFLAMKGLENMVSSIDSLDIPGENIAPLLGIVLTMVDYTNQYAYAKSKEIQIQYAKYAFETVIPFESSLQESTEVGKSIFDFSARSRSALSYWRLSKEVVERADRLRLESRIRQYTPNRVGSRATR
jgi:chromosome partitioning protein